VVTLGQQLLDDSSSIFIAEGEKSSATDKRGLTK
jgi:hypothetical protein